MMLVPPPERTEAAAREVWATVPFEHALLVGGLARATAAQHLGIRSLPWSSGKDADVVVFSVSDSEWQEWLKSLGAHSVTRFGGVRYVTKAGLRCDVFRYPEHDVHRDAAEELVTAEDYPYKVPAFSCDRFGLTRDLRLISPDTARLFLATQTLKLYKEPYVASWAATRIRQALSAGWRICNYASKWLESREGAGEAE